MTRFVVLSGGVGNQLFQLAAARGIDPADDVHCLVKPSPAGQLSLAELAPNVVHPVTQRDRWRLGAPYRSPSLPQRVVQRGLRVVRRRVEQRTYRQSTAWLATAFETKPAFSQLPMLLDGFFQHPSWFEGVLEVLLEQLWAASPLTPSVEPDSAVLCVRGGDYRSLGWALGTAYYQAAANVAPRSHFTVVGDDPESAGEVMAALEGTGHSYSWAGDGPTTEFWRIATAQTVVMANSTFCWWATTLGDYAAARAGITRTVIAPAGWVCGQGVALIRPGWVHVESE